MGMDMATRTMPPINLAAVSMSIVVVVLIYSTAAIPLALAAASR